MTRFFSILLAATLLIAAPARAGTYRIDDSASVVESPSVRMRWDEIAPGGASRVTGKLTVHARLDVSPWTGRMGRIYLTLPTTAAPPVTATWTTRGRLLPGALRSGERTLVYAGPIPGPVLEDTLQLVLQADGRELVRGEQLSFTFEIDLETP